MGAGSDSFNASPGGAFRQSPGRARGVAVAGVPEGVEWFMHVASGVEAMLFRRDYPFSGLYRFTWRARLYSSGVRADEEFTGPQIGATDTVELLRSDLSVIATFSPTVAYVTLPAPAHWRINLATQDFGAGPTPPIEVPTFIACSTFGTPLWWVNFAASGLSPTITTPFPTTETYQWFG